MGFGARGLKDKDWGPGVSDPYLVISRPSPNGGFQILRTSEVKKNSLNPDWNDFLFNEDELNGYDESLNLKFEVFDDDGKKGPDAKDKLLGTGYFNLKQIEAAATIRSPLQLGDGKKGKSAGNLLVRNVTRHQAQPGQGGQCGAGQGYPPPQQRAGGYPAPAQTGYPQAGGYPSQGPAYPPHGSPYPGVGGPGYAPAPGEGYPAGPGGGYPPVGPGYPAAGGPGYPDASVPSYPAPGVPGYPAEGASYPPAGGPGYPPAGGPGYPPAGGPGYPPASGAANMGGFVYPPQ